MGREREKERVCVCVRMLLCVEKKWVIITIFSSCYKEWEWWLLTNSSPTYWFSINLHLSFVPFLLLLLLFCCSVVQLFMLIVHFCQFFFNFFFPYYHSHIINNWIRSGGSLGSFILKHFSNFLLIEPLFNDFWNTYVTTNYSFPFLFSISFFS